MSGPAQKATDLLDIAVTTYLEEIAPALPKEKRYVGAMVANALGAAHRRLTHGDPDAALVETLGTDDMKSLAKSIRAGETSDQTHEGISQALMAYLEAQLTITNPKFLQRRSG
jgi:pantoate kinase